jgi:hypothetical protein
MTKVYHLVWNAEYSQNFNIFPFVFYGFKSSHRMYLRWHYLRDCIWARRRVNQTGNNSISSSCINFILYRHYWDGKMEKHEMAGHLALLALMKNVYTKSIWKLCGKVWGSHIGESEGQVTCSEYVPLFSDNPMACLNFHPPSLCIYFIVLSKLTSFTRLF